MLYKFLGPTPQCCCCVASVVSNSVRPHRWQPTRLPYPWDSPGKNTGMGCHFLLQCMKVKSKSEVTQSCPTLSNPMDCTLPGSSVHGVFQATVLEWVAIAFSATPHYWIRISIGGTRELIFSTGILTWVPVMKGWKLISSEETELINKIGRRLKHHQKGRVQQPWDRSRHLWKIINNLGNE